MKRLSYFGLLVLVLIVSACGGSPTPPASTPTLSPLDLMRTAYPPETPYPTPNANGCMGDGVKNEEGYCVTNPDSCAEDGLRRSPNGLWCVTEEEFWELFDDAEAGLTIDDGDTVNFVVNFSTLYEIPSTISIQPGNTIELVTEFGTTYASVGSPIEIYVNASKDPEVVAELADIDYTNMTVTIK